MAVIALVFTTTGARRALVRIVVLTLALSLLSPVSLPTTAAATTAGSFGDERRFGVATSSNGWDAGELEDVANLAGAAPSIVLHYLGFVDELHTAQLQAVADAGAVSLLTWEPFDWTGRTPDDHYALRRISAGAFDPYLVRTARTLQAFGEPVLLRFAHEMNGDWYPWSERNNGNQAGDYVAAWRHVHAVFADLGVDNVVWVWSPNVEYPGSLPLAGLYPGDDLVDAIALDGYNWGSMEGHTSGWQTPAEVFDPTLEAVRALAPGLPVMIGETGSTDEGGDKAAWIESLFPWLAARDIDTLVWFHLDKEADWRIDSSSGAAEAFRAGLPVWLAGGDGDLPADEGDDPAGENPASDLPDDPDDGDGADGPDHAPLVILTPGEGDRIEGELRVTGRVMQDYQRVDVQVAGAKQQARPDADGRWELVFAHDTLASGTHQLTADARGPRGLRVTQSVSLTIVEPVSSDAGGGGRRGGWKR